MKTISLPANIFESKAIVALTAEFGRAAQIAIVMILCEIAKTGYFIPWDNLQKNFMARNIDLEPDVLDRIIERLVEYEYFDGEMFAKYKVLTSLDLQKRFFRSRKRRERINDFQFLLPSIIAKYSAPKNDTQTKCEADNNADIQAEITDAGNPPAPSKTKVVRLFAERLKGRMPNEQARKHALAFHNRATLAKWHFADSTGRRTIPWQQAALECIADIV